MVLKKTVFLIVLLVTTLSTLIQSYEHNPEQDPGFGIHYYYDHSVVFYYYSREFPEGIPMDTLPKLQRYIDVSKPTKIITHGWRSTGKGPTCTFLKDGFLKRYDTNVLVMDWSEISGTLFYPLLLWDIYPVGEHYGKYLNYLVDEVGVEPEDIHLVGHSLGAHVSGLAGRELRNEKVARITGLDPAFPLFLHTKRILNEDDAEFVDVIHTCDDFFGYPYPIGHADFYPDGGTLPQPGCGDGWLELDNLCSHRRSWEIFASSLLRDKLLMATKCATFDDIKNNNTCTGYQVPIGHLTPSYARGFFYIEISVNDLVHVSA